MPKSALRGKLTWRWKSTTMAPSPPHRRSNMTAHSLLRFFLATAIVAVLGGPAAAQPPPVGYRVNSWGYYDRLPFATPLGSTYSYTEGRPVMSYVDPWGRVVDMPLRPKVFY